MFKVKKIIMFTIKRIVYYIGRTNVVVRVPVNNKQHNRVQLYKIDPLIAGIRQ